MAHVAAARSLGPLSIPAVQYFVIAVGAYTLLPPGSTVISVLDSVLKVARQVSSASQGGAQARAGENLPVVINMPGNGG